MVAAADAQQYSRSLAQRRAAGPDAPAPFEVWDREALLALLESTPAISLNGWPEEPLAALLGLLADATRGQLTSRGIERETRAWVGGDLHRASLAAAVVGNRLLETDRPDLAVAAGCCLLRAAAVAAHDGDDTAVVAFDAGRRLVEVYASTIVEALATVIEDPEGLLRVGVGLFGAVGYRVRCSVMAESLGLLGLLRVAEDDADGAAGMADLLARFVGAQPGAAQPMSDRWAVSLIPPALLLRRTYSDVLVRWLENVVVWVCDHHVRAPGLASMYANPADEVRYLAGGPFEHRGPAPPARVVPRDGAAGPRCGAGVAGALPGRFQRLCGGGRRHPGARAVGRAGPALVRRTRFGVRGERRLRREPQLRVVVEGGGATSASADVVCASAGGSHLGAPGAVDGAARPALPAGHAAAGRPALVAGVKARSVGGVTAVGGSAGGHNWDRLFEGQTWARRLRAQPVLPADARRPRRWKRSATAHA